MRSHIIECPVCKEHVVALSDGTPAKHYQKGNGQCPGGPRDEGAMDAGS